MSKLLKQEVFGPLETIVNQAKKDELDAKEIKQLKAKLDHHLLSLERKLKSDWTVFQFGFFVEPVTVTQDAIEFEIRRSSTIYNLFVEYDFCPMSLIISGDKLVFEPKDKVYIIEALVDIISDHGRLTQYTNPVKRERIQDAVVKFLS